MIWTSFLTGSLVTAFAFALFKSEDEPETELIEEEGNDILVNDFNTRHVTLSCQTCRKLKRHKEIEPNLYQCAKCKRHVDLRVS